MGIGEAIKKGLSVVKSSMDLVLVIFLFGAVWNIINVFLNPNAGSFTATTPPDVATMTKLALVGLVFLFISIYMQGGSLGYIRDRIKLYHAGLPSFSAAGGKYYLKILGLGALIASIAIVLILAGAIVMAIFAKSEKLSIVAAIFMLLAFAAVIYMALLFILAPYAIVANDEKVIASVKQSIRLVRQNMLKIVGILLLLILIGFAIGIVLGLLFAALATAVPGKTSAIIFAVLSSFVNAFLGVIVSGSLMAFYLSISQNSYNTSDAK